jgi:hypothetical protein
MDKGKNIYWKYRNQKIKIVPFYGAFYVVAVKDKSKNRRAHHNIELKDFICFFTVFALLYRSIFFLLLLLILGLIFLLIFLLLMIHYWILMNTLSAFELFNLLKSSFFELCCHKTFYNHFQVGALTLLMLLFYQAFFNHYFQSLAL